MSALVDLLARVPDGWSVATYDGRRYGVTKETRADGRAISVYAEELGGMGVVSTNVYVTTGGEELRPCEMPAEKVLVFLREATFGAEHASPGDARVGPLRLGRGAQVGPSAKCAQAGTPANQGRVSGDSRGSS